MMPCLLCLQRLQGPAGEQLPPGLLEEERLALPITGNDFIHGGGFVKPAIQHGVGAVSYTHLTLPTNREV